MREQCPASAKLKETLNGLRQRPRFLIIEDDQEDLSALRKTVVEAGCDMDAVRTGEEAMELIRCRADSFDVILLDLTLPGMNGVEALRTLKQIAPQASVVIATGAHPDSPLLLAAIDIGVVSVKKKPVTIQDVQDILEHLNLETPEPRPALTQ